MTTLFAFLHHVAAFGLVAALAIELVLLKDVTSASAGRLARVDAVFGLCSGAVLVIGLLRVFYFEKGAAFYFHNLAFVAKLALFAVVGLLSIYPTVRIL